VYFQKGLFLKTSISKAERLLQEEYIILTHPGLRRTEIAEKLGVHRSTVSRDIDETCARQNTGCL